MNYRIALVTLFAFFCTTVVKAQNISGLENKKLNKVEDAGAALESLIGRIGGRIDGNIDSVIVVSDSETELRVKIFYSGYVSGFFAVSTMNDSRQREQKIIPALFSQAASASPAECVLKFDDRAPGNPLASSPYLRIDISKRQGSSGKVKIFELRKKWGSGSMAETGQTTQSMLVHVMLQPVGVAASLPAQPPVKDVVPGKKIIFDPQSGFNKPEYNKSIRTPMRAGGGNSYRSFGVKQFQIAADISGIWNNADVSTTGLTKIVITNNQAQVFYKCSPKDCELGKSMLTGAGTDAYRAYFDMVMNAGGRPEMNFESRTELFLQLVNNELQVKQTETKKTVFNTVSKTKNYIFKRNQFTYLTPKVLTVNDFAIMQPTTPTQSVEALGPSKDKVFVLWNEIAVDNQVNFSRPQDISNINSNIIPDQNDNSGIFYMIPADYHLRWESGNPSKKPEEGYDLSIIYGAQRTGGTEPTDAPVLMSAKLTAGISKNEVSFVKAMMKAINPRFVDIRFLPLKENPICNISNSLKELFEIPLDRISVTANTDLTNDITLSWRTNPDTKELIQTKLTSGDGINSQVILKPKNEDIVDQNIPASINLADPRSLGRMILEPTAWRTRNWTNNTPYPLQIKYLHVLKKATGENKLIVYSWSMNNVAVPPMGQVNFDHSRVPAWLDTDPTAMIWLDYNVMECSDCDRKVIEAVTGGVFGSTTQQVKFTIAPAVFDTLKAAYFMVYIRSKQADPKGETIKELAALKVTNDGAKEFLAGPLFLTPGGQMDYEYRITAASTDGDFYPSDKWIKGSNREVLLGKTAMKELFKGIIPGIN